MFVNFYILTIKFFPNKYSIEEKTQLKLRLLLILSLKHSLQQNQIEYDSLFGKGKVKTNNTRKGLKIFDCRPFSLLAKSLNMFSCCTCYLETVLKI